MTSKNICNYRIFLKIQFKIFLQIKMDLNIFESFIELLRKTVHDLYTNDNVMSYNT